LTIWCQGKALKKVTDGAKASNWLHFQVRYDGPTLIDTAQVDNDMRGIIVDSTVEDAHIVLPSTPVMNQRHIIKDGSGAAFINPIYIDGNGNTIDGLPSIAIAFPYESKTLEYNGVEWSVV
jgi:hypothetical protein